jgi:hypothetical protein
MNRAQPEPPFTLEFAAALLAECKRRGLILSIDAGVIRIADPSRVDNAPHRYTMRQAAQLLAGGPLKTAARTPGRAEIDSAPPAKKPAVRAMIVKERDSYRLRAARR